MNLKLVGALLIMITSGVVGLKMCVGYLRQCSQLEDLLRTFHYMKCELQYRLTPLPSQFRQCVDLTGGVISRFYRSIYMEMSTQILPNAQCCINIALDRNKDLFPITQNILRRLGSTLGSFDLSGQIAGIEEVISYCNEELERLKKDKPIRVRNYQTLSLCTGAALVIVLI